MAILPGQEHLHQQQASHPELGPGTKVHDTPEGRAKINAAVARLGAWALEHGEPWQPEPEEADRS